MGVGLKSSGDPGRDFSCWELLLQGLLVGLGRGGDSWSWGELGVGVGACGRVGLGVGLNSWGEELWLVYSKLLVRGMHGVTDRASLNWLHGVSCTVLVLSSGVGGGWRYGVQNDDGLYMLKHEIYIRFTTSKQL